MWIRSQDKTKLINTNDITFHKVESEKESKTLVLVIPHEKKEYNDRLIEVMDETYAKVERTITDTKYKYVFNNELGTYLTKEEAIKVLDKIQKEKCRILFRNKVFQMPQESKIK